MTLTLQQIEQTSRLIRGATMIGANYRVNNHNGPVIMLKDKRVVVVEDFANEWRFWVKKDRSLLLKKSATPEEIRDHLFRFLGNLKK